MLSQHAPCRRPCKGAPSNQDWCPNPWTLTPTLNISGTRRRYAPPEALLESIIAAAEQQPLNFPPAAMAMLLPALRVFGVALPTTLLWTAAAAASDVEGVPPASLVSTCCMHLRHWGCLAAARLQPSTGACTSLESAGCIEHSAQPRQCRAPIHSCPPHDLPYPWLAGGADGSVRRAALPPQARGDACSCPAPAPGEGLRLQLTGGGG